MGVLDWFKKSQKFQKESTWKELGTYKAQFSGFGNNIYASDTVRACVRPLAEHSGKANAVSSDEMIARVLNISPNLYMNGKDFLSKVRTKLELNNTAFILIMRADNGKANGFYPIPYCDFVAVEANGKLYIEFHFAGSAARQLTVAWDDLAVVRKDYNESDIAGDSNTAILKELDLINTTKQGVANAVKATANLRGILKSTKAMLRDEDIKKQKEAFVRDYLSLENDGGIASLDSTQEFTPISMSPTITNWETLKEFRENVYRYFGVNDHIVMSDYTESQMEAFYEARIEPFLVALGTELTKKCFTERERGFGAYIMFESNRISYASTATKLNMVQMVDRGALTPNEWRQIFNLAPIEGGDVPIRRLDTEVVNDNNLQKQNEGGNDD